MQTGPSDPRRHLATKLAKAAQTWPSVTLTGSWQSGKTTLCRALFAQLQYETLEAPDVRAFAATEDPCAFPAQFPEGVVLDEVHRVPDLFSCLQGITDADPVPVPGFSRARKSLSLLESVSQSLAGRMAVHDLLASDGRGDGPFFLVSRDSLHRFLPAHVR